MGLSAFPPTYPIAFAPGTIPYLKPNVPATGSNVTPAPSTVPSAPNLTFDFATSAALSLTDKTSKYV